MPSIYIRIVLYLYEHAASRDRIEDRVMNKAWSVTRHSHKLTATQRSHQVKAGVVRDIVGEVSDALII